jgi:hypothetical protein
MVAANDADADSSLARRRSTWTILGSWVASVAGILLLHVPAYWIILVSAAAAVVARRTGPAKLWLFYAAAAIIVAAAFVWTGALFTHSPETAGIVTG